MGCPVPAYAANYSASSFYNFFLLAAPPFITHAIRNRATFMLLPAGGFLPLSAFLSVPFPRCNWNRQLSAASLEAFGLIFPHIPPRRKPPLPAACFHMLLQFQSDSVGLVTSADIGRNRAAPVTCDASSRIRCHYVFCFFINAFGRSRNHFPSQR